MRFSGFRSRWTIPRECAWASADQDALEDARGLEQRETGSHPRSDPRSKYSIAMNAVPSCSKYSCTVTMFGWFSEPATRDSRRKRSTNSGSEA